MDYEAKTHRYEASAEREQHAAARAVSPESARVHLALAEMYRHEAAKMRSVGKMLCDPGSLAGRPRAIDTVTMPSNR